MDTCRGREDERNVKAIAGIPSYSRAEEMQNHKSSFESSSAASSAPMTAPESTYHLKQITRTLCLGFPYGPTADRDYYGGRGRERRLYTQPPSFLRRPTSRDSPPDSRRSGDGAVCLPFFAYVHSIRICPNNREGSNKESLEMQLSQYFCRMLVVKKLPSFEMIYG